MIMDEKQRKEVIEKAKKIRHDIVDMIGCSGKVGHLGGRARLRISLPHCIFTR
jgi:hypothetical protein